MRAVWPTSTGACAVALMSAFSARHGWHQLAPKVSQTGWPLNALSWTDVPSIVVSNGTAVIGTVLAGADGLIKAGDGIRKVVNNSVIVSAGGVLPNDFLRAVGIEVDTKYGTA